MIGDHYQDKWKTLPYTYPPNKNIPSQKEEIEKLFKSPVTREEFEALKKEVLEMKELLKRAKEYDEKNNEPHCEIENKMDFLRKVSALVGINLDDVIGKKV